jgi:hypothetical protein
VVDHCSGKRSTEHRPNPTSQKVTNARGAILILLNQPPPPEAEKSPPNHGSMPATDHQSPPPCSRGSAVHAWVPCGDDQGHRDVTFYSTRRATGRESRAACCIMDWSCRSSILVALLISFHIKPFIWTTSWHLVRYLIIGALVSFRYAKL